MRYTLLELTQDILSSMDSDEVNSITDTVESLQVVAIIKTVYDDIVSRSSLAEHKTLFNLDASTNSAQPVLMTKPDNIDKVDWVKYNKILDSETDPVWVEMKFLPIDEFTFMMHQLTPSEVTVDTMTYTTAGFTFTFNYRTDVGPTYYTSFDDNTLIFDAYDSEVDSTLQSSKTLCYGRKIADWEEADTFTPNLQPQQFALLLNEAKSLAWAELKQMPHAKAEHSARRNWIHQGKNRQNITEGKFQKKAHPFAELANFGRRR